MVYYVVVHGQGIEEGDFLLELTTVLDPRLPPIEVSDPCPALDKSELVAVGSSISGSTSLEPIYNVESCGNLVFSTAPGLWFRVVGTGGALQVNTCDDETNFDTQISVFTGACGLLECIDGNDQGGVGCGDSSAVSWFSVAGQEYFILVHGFGERIGDFVLNVEEITIETSEDCGTGVEIVPDGTSRLGLTLESNDTDGDVPECFNALEGAGAWYTFEGTGNDITASTCQQSSTTSTSVTIFRGDSCGSLECVEGVATPCGAQSSVAFPTSESETYYVYVQTPELMDSSRNLQEANTTAPEGLFVLTAEPTPANDRCDQKVPLLPSDGSATFGSTRSATPTNDGSCSVESSLGRGVWYTVFGTGDEMVASTCSEFTNFVSFVEIYSGSCDSLSCVDAATSQCEIQGSVARWDSVEGVLYYVYVSGIGVDEYGNFALSIGSGNDSCFGAQLLPNDGSVVVGSTINATFDGSVPDCGDNFVTSPGVWYIYHPIDTTASLTATTCHNETEYETEITVYRGGCGDLVCADQISTGLCGDQKSTVTWAPIRGEKFYYIHVHGYGVGNFGLNVVEGNGSCESSTDISLLEPSRVFGDLTEYSLSGTTTGMPETDAAAGCGIEHLSPGAWFAIEGSGTTMRINACNEETPFNSQISVFKGGNCEADLECVGTTEGFFTCEVDLFFDTEFGEQYFILVHGGLNPQSELEQGESGDFAFTVRREEPAFCESSIAVSLDSTDGQIFFVENSIAEGGESIGGGQCGGAEDFGFGGHWYSVVGTGKNMTASSCFAGTELDTQITVYSGSCRALECVDGNDDASSGEEGFETRFPEEGFETGFPEEGFETRFPEIPDEFNGDFGPGDGIVDGEFGPGNGFESELALRSAELLENCALTSTVSWPSEAGVVYYVFIHGYDGDVGNYELLIASEE